jgi:hypothetical protein
MPNEKESVLPEAVDLKKVSEKVESVPTPPKPEPMVPPVTPTVVAEKVKAGSIFWLFVPVPICVAYDDIPPLTRMGRVKVEAEIVKLIDAQIGKPRKQKGKDEWALKVQYPVNPGDVVKEQCDRAVGQIRAAIGELV